MGLLPSWLDNCGSNMFSIYEDAEDAILADMARRIATYDYYIPAAEYQRQVLEQMGATQQYILSELSRRTGKTQSELKQLMQEAGIEAVRSDAEIYRKNGKAVPDQASAVMQNILAAGYQQTAGAFDNLCRTTARAGSSQFLRELNTAWLMVSGGGMSLDQATRAAIKRLAASGLDAVSYASGRKLSLDSAVRMTVRTGINQTAAKLQLQFAAEMDSDLVEVTAHAGARPSHAEWQGKVYSISGKTKGYRKLEDATGYGTVDGLCGANCRHNMFPFFEGESGAYSKRELEEYTRPDAVTYNGKSMSLYEAQQLQRYQERQIRRWKREYVCSQAAGIDTLQAAAKLAEWNSTHMDFLQQTGLKIHFARGEVVGFGSSQAKKAASVVKKIDSIKLDIQSEKYSLLVNPDKQNRHMIGNGYIQGRSAITIGMKELQSLVNQFAGAGTVILDRKGEWKNQEIIDFGREVGYTVNKDGREVKTSKAKIHYSKTGVHVVPYSGKG